MKLRLLNDADQFAIETVTGLQNPRSLAALIVEYIRTFPDDEDAHIEIHKHLLPDSYRSNPSQYAVILLGKMNGSHDYKDASGFQTPANYKTVTIQLHANKKPSNARRNSAHPSIKRVIKEWLDLELPHKEKLRIPVLSVPKFYLTHSAQLTYQIKLETQIRIKILKLTKSWLISRK